MEKFRFGIEIHRQQNLTSKLALGGYQCRKFLNLPNLFGRRPSQPQD
jgi:hypothetical protein